MSSTKKQTYDVIVIGGGASGLMAAITAARSGAKTLILEHKDRIGKKILVTGNGKCNYTNALQGITYYRGDNPAFVLPILEQFGLSETLAFFEEIGVYPKCKNGYYYPASEQAAAMLEVLRMEVKRLRITVCTECELYSVKKIEDGTFLAKTNQDTFCGTKVIFATGLLASPKTGSDGSAFQHIEKFGHTFVDVVPALVALQGKQSFFKALAGIRSEIFIKMFIDQKQIATETGELQLTDYGISGIPVFQLSRFATKALKKKQQVYVLLDFMPAVSEDDLKNILTKRFKNAGEKNNSECLIGMFNKKLGDVLLKESGFELSAMARNVSEKQITELVKNVKALRVDVTGSKTFENAQVCAGGVDTRELHNDSLESKLIPGLYFAGEVIDIDGICGGYNLQWAWSSGYVAGRHAARRDK